MKNYSVIHALNAANVERYNEVTGFIWDPQLIDINKLVTLVQGAYPAQVVECALGRGKKLSSETEDTDKHKVEVTAGLFPPTKHTVEVTAGLFPPTKPKAINNYNETFRDFNEEQSINEVNDNDRESYEPPYRNCNDYRSRSRSSEDSTHKERQRCDTTDRRNRHDSYTGRSDSSYNYS